MSDKEIREISDLPYYREEYAEILEDKGIFTIDDLLFALYDEESAEDIQKSLKGVGPKVIDQWIQRIEDDGIFEEEPEEEPEEAEEEPEVVIEEEPQVEIEETIEEPDVEIEEPEVEVEEEAEDDSEILEEGSYVVKQKPELDEGTLRLLEEREKKSSQRPKFRRQEWFRYKKLGDEWRRPKGLHSKLRRNYKYRPAKANIGHRGPKEVRGLHPSGFEEVMVHNSSQLEDVDPKTQAVRVGSTVGFKKRLDIEKKADELGIRVLNRMG